MIKDDDRISTLINRPSESLNVELKTWLDPSTDEGKAKLIKAIFAIRNRNGGYLIIGLNDTTGLPDPYSFDKGVEEVFHTDIIIGLVSRYASMPFEISVAMRERDKVWFPVIVIPEGVRVPAIVKQSLLGNGGKKLLQAGDVYFRTLQTNGTPSSAILSAADWPDLLEICFENREADIGRFLRRHLPGLDASSMASLVGNDPKRKLHDRAMALITEGISRAEKAVVSRSASAELARIVNALTMRVGLVLDPPRSDAQPTNEFMNKVAASNPQFTGWPIWLDSRNFYEVADRAIVIEGAWQALIVDLSGSWPQHFEFLRFDPKGDFYLQRVMQDDLSDKVTPLAVMDAPLMIYRVAEVFAVGVSIARNLGWNHEASAGFAFHWTGLKDRRLSSWANPNRFFEGPNSGQSHSFSAQAFATVPVNTPLSALAPYVEIAVAPLFACFDGYAAPQELVETCVRKLIERKMEG